MGRNLDVRQKPPLGSYINWEHQLAQGLVDCWLFNEGAGTRANNLCFGSAVTPTSPIWRDNGIAMSGGSASIIPFTASASYVVDAVPLAADSYAQLVMASAASNGTTGPTFNSDGLDWYCSLSEAGIARTCYRFGSPKWVVGARATKAMVYDSLAATLNLYTNGRLGQGSLTGSVPSSQTEQPAISFNPDSKFRFFRLLRYGRVLSAGELAQLYYEPYCFIDWPVARFWSIPAAPGGITYIPSLWHQQTVEAF